MSTAVTTPSDNNPSLPPAPSNSPGHTLLFYEDDSALLEGLSESICTAICSGNSALIVATAAHHNGLVTFLRARCAETHTAIIEGRLFLLDAEETLSRIMVKGQLDPDLCISVIGNYITMLAAAARGEGAKVFAYGELVSILWERGNQTAALHLELLCRQLVEHSPLLQLCCGYPLRLFPSDTGPTPIVKIETRRTRVLLSKDIPTTTR
jgi:MEDS: MEthanogen/methylotroph, DcmR Sensory domain